MDLHLGLAPSSVPGKGSGVPALTATTGFVEGNFCKVTRKYFIIRTKHFIFLLKLKSLFTSAKQQVGIIHGDLHELSRSGSRSSETGSTSPDSVNNLRRRSHCASGCHVGRSSSAMEASAAASDQRGTWAAALSRQAGLRLVLVRSSESRCNGNRPRAPDCCSAQPCNSM